MFAPLWEHANLLSACVAAGAAFLLIIRHALPDDLVFGLIAKADRPVSPGFRAFLLMVVVAASLFCLDRSGWVANPAGVEGAPDSLLNPVLLATFFAVAGWVTTNTNASIHQRKQHSLRVLFEMRHSTLYQGYTELIEQLVAEVRKARAKAQQKPASSIGVGALSLAETRLSYEKPVCGGVETGQYEDAIDYILNHFEFIALSVRNGDLDPHFVRKSQAGLIIRTYKLFEVWIETYAGVKRIHGKRYATNRIYEHFLWLIGWYAELMPDRDLGDAIRPYSAYQREVHGVLHKI